MADHRHLSPQENQELRKRKLKVIKDWIKLAKNILIHIQLRDNLEKTVVVLDYDGNERRILLKPKSSIDLEERSFP